MSYRQFATRAISIARSAKKLLRRNVVEKKAETVFHITDTQKSCSKCARVAQNNNSPRCAANSFGRPNTIIRLRQYGFVSRHFAFGRVVAFVVFNVVVDVFVVDHRIFPAIWQHNEVLNLKPLYLYFCLMKNGLFVYVLHCMWIGSNRCALRIHIFSISCQFVVAFFVSSFIFV